MYVKLVFRQFTSTGGLNVSDSVTITMHIEASSRI